MHAPVPVRHTFLRNFIQVVSSYFLFAPNVSVKSSCGTVTPPHTRTTDRSAPRLFISHVSKVRREGRAIVYGAGLGAPRRGQVRGVVENGFRKKLP